jgi:hypothetical protein
VEQERYEHIKSKPLQSFRPINLSSSPPQTSNMIEATVTKKRQNVSPFDALRSLQLSLTIKAAPLRPNIPIQGRRKSPAIKTHAKNVTSSMLYREGLLQHHIL